MPITIKDVEGLDEFRDLIFNCMDKKAKDPADYDTDKDKTREILKSNIEKDGFLDPIKCWQDPDDPNRTYIIDGYTRMSIWHEIGEDVGVRGLKKKMVPEVEMVRGLRDRDDVKLWIIQNQLGRRNLNAAQRSWLRGKQYQMTKKKRGGNEQANPPILPPPTAQIDPLVDNTADRVSGEDNVSPATVKRDAARVEKIDRIAEEAPEFAEKLKNENVVSEMELTEIAESANIVETIETVMERKVTRKQEGPSLESLERLVVKHIELAKAALLKIDQKTGRFNIMVDTQSYLHKAFNLWNGYIRGKR